MTRRQRLAHGAACDHEPEQAEDDTSPLERVAAGHYTVRRDQGGAGEGQATAREPTHRRALQVARLLHAGGRESWTLRNLVEALAVGDGAAVGRRRMHDVVTSLRGMKPPLVEPERHGTFALTLAGRAAAAV